MSFLAKPLLYLGAIDEAHFILGLPQKLENVMQHEDKKRKSKKTESEQKQPLTLKVVTIETVFFSCPLLDLE